MYITLDGKHKIFYLDMTRIVAFQIEKSRVQGPGSSDEGTASFFFPTGQSLTISLSWEDLYKLRIELNKLITEQSQPIQTD